MVFNTTKWPIEKMHQVIWDALQDYGRIKWQWTLSNLEKAPNVAYQDILDEFDSVRGVKVLIVTRSNFVVTWKVGPQIDIIS